MSSASVLRVPLLVAIGYGLALLNLAGCSGVGWQSGEASSPDTVASGDAAVRTTAVIVGRPARVFVLAGFGTRCEPVAPPEITITEQPAKGTVTFVSNQETVIQHSAQGTCIGQKVRGTGIYYTARGQAEGRDHFSILAKLASGETMTRRFDLQIAE